MDDLSSEVDMDDTGCTGNNVFEGEVNERHRCKAYDLVLKSYDQLQNRIHQLEAAKNKIKSYTPGAWIEYVGGTRMWDFDVPETTTLLLIGPKGSGKSSLINRISRVFERAQVSYNLSTGEGTYFLHEHMIPRGSTSFCLYDTRGLSFDSSANVKILNQWMTKGVRHGELVMRDSDCSNLVTEMKRKARQTNLASCKRREVNFVIFVVNGFSVLKSIDNDEACYTSLVASMFGSPLLSSKDDKPVVVITHGDLLSLSDRARVRVHLGEVLGIPPNTQIFDIPESCDPAVDLTITDMLHCSLALADRNLPGKSRWLKSKVLVASFPPELFLMILWIVFLACMVAHEIHNDWHANTHMWLLVRRIEYGVDYM